MEQLIVLGGLVAAIAAIWNTRLQHRLAVIALASLAAANVLLAFRFLSDDFSYRQVWLQSDPQLTWWLKLAGLWSGDEGTLLLLALISAALALRLLKYGPAAAAGAWSVTTAFAAGALIWSPFMATNANELAVAPYRGMNAHLTSVWMLVHPPLVFASYLLLIAPAGAMVDGLANGSSAWRAISARYGRTGWLLISAGIVFGMWWAYEDFTYGTLWHWDPVQTAVFAAWCHLTAMLHLQSRYRPTGEFALAHPLLGLLAAASAMTAMAVTRSGQLASSHRYVGETSLVLLGGMAAVILLATAAAAAWRLRALPARPNRPSGSRTMLWLAATFLVIIGLIAQLHLASAFLNAHLGTPRPDDLKPFFETLRNFTSGTEIKALRQAFQQWEVDNFSVNRWLVPVLFAAGLVGGHYVFPARSKWRWLTTLLVLVLATLMVVWLQPFERLFTGKGLTSGKTVALFSQLDALLAALAYFVAAACAAIAAQIWHRRSVMPVPTALIHIGIVMALVGGLTATIFDSFAQRFVDLPDAVGKTLAFPGGYSVSIAGLDNRPAEDGARKAGANHGFQTIGQVAWSLNRNGQTIDGGSGHTVYRDGRKDIDSGPGALRLMCEAIDYRFARYRSGDSQMIHPLISRGLLRDVQIWLPAVLPMNSEAVAGRPAPVVLKIFPLMSLVWLGLALSLLGAAWQTARHLVHRPPSSRHDLCRLEPVDGIGDL